MRRPDSPARKSSVCVDGSKTASVFDGETLPRNDEGAIVDFRAERVGNLNLAHSNSEPTGRPLGWRLTKAQCGDEYQCECGTRDRPPAPYPVLFVGHRITRTVVPAFETRFLTIGTGVQRQNGLGR
jgi:hypothetical protein